jgi:hypothetical protein
MAAIKFEINPSKKLRLEEGFGWVTKTLCTQKVANAFSLWNNNLGYQGILESQFKYHFKNLGFFQINHFVIDVITTAPCTSLCKLYSRRALLISL